MALGSAGFAGSAGFTALASVAKADSRSSAGKRCTTASKSTPEINVHRPTMSAPFVDNKCISITGGPTGFVVAWIKTVCGTEPPSEMVN